MFDLPTKVTMTDLVEGYAIPAGDPFFTKHINDDAECIAYAISLCQRYDYAVNVGAHVGSWSRPLAQAFDRVIAFEPVPYLADLHRQNVPEVTLFEVACASEPGLCRMGPVPGAVNSGQYRVTWQGPGFFAPRLPLNVLAEDLAAFPDLIKIDVEGNELDVLYGALDVLQDTVLVIEHRPDRICEQLLHHIGYKRRKTFPIMKDRQDFPVWNDVYARDC